MGECVGGDGVGELHMMVALDGQFVVGEKEDDKRHRLEGLAELSQHKLLFCLLHDLQVQKATARPVMSWCVVSQTLHLPSQPPILHHLQRTPFFCLLQLPPSTLFHHH